MKGYLVGKQVSKVEMEAASSALAKEYEAEGFFTFLINKIKALFS